MVLKARELNLESSIEVISNKHPAALNRYIYFKNRIHRVRKFLKDFEVIKFLFYSSILSI